MNLQNLPHISKIDGASEKIDFRLKECHIDWSLLWLLGVQISIKARDSL